MPTSHAEAAPERPRVSRVSSLFPIAPHKVKPGITGWAQVNGLRGETDTLDKMVARVDQDLHYIRHWSLWLDIKIIWLTVFGRNVRQNAY